ncbi:hypothetical protein BB558_005821 [Smittium angustum]|uniref:Uncharacterized protein n=1 Tax=Smittium angustum TaxID=133377 RepID=A0A2U1IZM5_SMIAN|nr:hypothetical protein BB558_005821 [Smittium angustum]
METSQNQQILARTHREESGFKEAEEYFELANSLYRATIQNHDWNENEFGLSINYASNIKQHSLQHLEKSTKHLIKILGRYQETPSLLDKDIELMVKIPLLLIEKFITQNTPIDNPVFPEDPIIDLLFRLLVEIANVRGIKKIIKFFSCKVESIEPVLEYLAYTLKTKETNGGNPKRNQTSTINSIYAEFGSKSAQLNDITHILLHWLALLANVPMDLRLIDSETSIVKKYNLDVSSITSIGIFDYTEPSLALDWLIIGLHRCYYGIGIENETASRLVGQLVKRTDISKFYLNQTLEIFNFSMNELMTRETQELSLTEVYKLNNLLVGLFNILSVIGISITEAHENDLVKHLELMWTSLKKSVDVDSLLIEEMISFLLDMISSKETVVRWSAVKGISRICCEVGSDEMTTDIVNTILSTFEESTLEKHVDFALADNWWERVDVSLTSNSSWHGCCLCLAEMLRLGLVKSESMFSKIVPFLLAALKYEIMRGGHMVGDNVRDAACYMAWCLARSDFKKAFLKDLVNELAKTLVCVMLFDKEVHVRRAASAAFQEFVGRSGSEGGVEFPHGIDVLLLADFYTVGNLQLVPEVAAKISLFDSYCKSITTHISLFPIFQIDNKIQLIAADSLERIFVAKKDDSEYMNFVFNSILPYFVSLVNSPESAIRTGSILGIRAFFSQKELYENIKNISLHNSKISQYVADVLNLPTTIHKSYLTGIVGSDTLISSLCGLGGYLAVNSNIDFASVYSKWESVFLLAFSKDNHDLQLKISKIWTKICFSIKFEIPYENLIDRIYEKASSFMESPTKNGSILALSCTNAFQNPETSEKVLNLLVDILVNENKNNSVESVRNAAITLGAFYSKENDNMKNDISLLNQKKLFLIRNLVYYGFSNYQSDHRGDVGSWVRLASINSVIQILSTFHNDLPIDTELYTILVSNCLELCASLQSNLRHQAGQLLSLLLSLKTNNSENMELARKIGTKLFGNYPEFEPPIDYISKNEAFTRLSQTFTAENNKLVDKKLLTGFVLAAGNLSESVSQSASAAFIQIFSKAEDNHKVYLLNLLIEMHSELNSVEPESKANDNLNQRQNTNPAVLLVGDKATSKGSSNTDIDSKNRLLLPLLRMIDLLFADQVFYFPGSEKPIDQIFFQVRKSAFKSRNLNRLMVCQKLYLEFAFFSLKMAKTCIVLLANYLKHPLPKVRQNAADHLYSFISLFEDYYPDSTMVVKTDSFFKEQTLNGPSQNGNQDTELEDLDEEDALTKVSNVLLETNWMNPIPMLKVAPTYVIDTIKVIANGIKDQN